MGDAAGGGPKRCLAPSLGAKGCAKGGAKGCANLSRNDEQHAQQVGNKLEIARRSIQLEETTTESPSTGLATA